MGLTPVRVRGKKRKPGTPAPAKQIPSQAPSASETPAKRVKTTSRKSKNRFISAMPSLQGLPQELLEIIFLESMNISLPRASPDLGRRLSSHAIIMIFVMRSFFETGDHRGGLGMGSLGRRCTLIDPSTQCQLLTCRFFTWQFFLSYVAKAQDALIKRRRQKPALRDMTVYGVEQFEDLRPFRFTRNIMYLSFAEGFQIPEKLLHGPWTDDQARLLYVLVSFTGEIDWHNSIAGETAKEGLREAIKEKNEYAVAALSVLVGIQKEITTAILRYAVIECGCEFNIIRHLLYNAQILASKTPREVLNLHDPQVWAWADEERNVEKGSQLKDMLKKADTFSLQFYLSSETDWSGMVRIVSFPYSGPLFDAKSDLDPVMRERLTRLYQTHGKRLTSERQ